jgi:hypothetical protein
MFKLLGETLRYELYYSLIYSNFTKNLIILIELN